MSEISGALKRTVEDAFGHVRVRGEISGYRGPHSSGHAYFTLKDDRARIEAVVWRSAMARLRFRPEEGMEVIATGRITTYPGSSKYQIVIDHLEPAGAGALMALLEERKRRLAAEGLFEAARKRPLPFMPRVIGVVTSPTGAVIRDILHRIADRFPVHVLVWPVRVQGETAGAEATAAVNGFNALAPGGRVPRPDLLIVARGGGSLEDLWGFNDEALARAVAASTIPVISAIGHETDWTLVDFVADMRAPTPTGAAELAVPVKAELEAALAGLGARLAGAAGGPSTGAARRCGPPRGPCPRPTSCWRCRGGGTTRRPRGSPGRWWSAPSASGRGSARCASRRRCSGGTWRRRASISPAPSASCRAAPAPISRSGGDGSTAAASRVTAEPLMRRVGLAAREHARLAERLPRAIDARLERQRAGLAQSERLLATLSHQGILERGFALVTDAAGTLVKRAEAVTPGAHLTLQFADGKAEAIATGEAARRPQAKDRAKLKGPGGQGSLF